MGQSCALWLLPLILSLGIATRYYTIRGTILYEVLYSTRYYSIRGTIPGIATRYHVPLKISSATISVLELSFIFILRDLCSKVFKEKTLKPVFCFLLLMMLMNEKVNWRRVQKLKQIGFKIGSGSDHFTCANLAGRNITCDTIFASRHITGQIITT